MYPLLDHCSGLSRLHIKFAGLPYGVMTYVLLAARQPNVDAWQLGLCPLWLLVSSFITDHRDAYCHPTAGLVDENVGYT